MSLQGTAGQRPDSGGGESGSAKVLCVDLDGTLIRSDLLWESLLLGLKGAPGATLGALFGLRHGKAALKARLVGTGGRKISVETLPYDAEVLSFLEARHAEGWRIELISGSHQSLVDRVARYLGLFQAWFGSDERRNLTGEAKAAFLAERHPDGFAYLGNSVADRAPWATAAESLSANAPAWLIRQMRTQGTEIREISKPPALAKALLKGMRLHQWSKNALLFTILLLTLDERSLADFLWLVAAFLAFGLVASATYLFNDLLDIEADRAHATKRARPFASGALPIAKGFGLIAAILGLGLGLGALIGTEFLAHLAAYTVLTATYSIALKSVAVLDVLIVGSLFSLRILAGAAAIDGEVAPWLAVFSLLFFSSLAFAKRYVEMLNKGTDDPRALAGRGYVSEDRIFVFGFGAALATSSLLVFLLYAFSGESRALSNTSVAMVCLGAISYWIMRVWLFALRGELNDDPVLFAIKDRVSYAVAAVVVGALLIDRWM